MSRPNSPVSRSIVDLPSRSKELENPPHWDISRQTYTSRIPMTTSSVFPLPSSLLTTWLWKLSLRQISWTTHRAIVHLEDNSLVLRGQSGKVPLRTLASPAKFAVLQAKEAYHILSGHQQTILLELDSPSQSVSGEYCLHSTFTSTNLVIARTVRNHSEKIH